MPLDKLAPSVVADRKSGIQFDERAYDAVFVRFFVTKRLALRKSER